MSNFKALMALSRSQTEETQGKVDAAMAQRQRNEALKRKKQEEYERRERERDRAQRELYFAKLKLEKEHSEKLERERQATLAELARREQEQREAMRYGPKRPKSASVASNDGSGHRQSSSSSATHDDARKRRPTSCEVGGGESLALVLTREEKRQRKHQAKWREGASPRKRSSHSRKSSGRLPGGAIDVTEISRNSPSGTPAQSVKERLSAIPMTLTKLNLVKRDLRTIDEILQDRAKAREVKVLNGDQAREFHDWFGASKKKEPNSRGNSASLPASRTGTPVAGTSTATTTPHSLSAKTSLIKVIHAPKPSNGASKLSNTRDSAIHRGSERPSLSSETSTQSSLSASSQSPRKRSRSSSFTSPSPPPARKSSSGQNDQISSEIWKLFGKDRDAYVRRPVSSDDEDTDDMEADTESLWAEERKSARVAIREDLEAEEAEMHHAEAKRRQRQRKAL